MPTNACRLLAVTVSLAAASIAQAQTLGDLYREFATLVASDGATEDEFGSSISLDGDTLAVGVRRDDVGANLDQGSVRVFVRIGSTWTLQATLLASGGAAGDEFGRTVSLSGDTLAVGAATDDVGANVDQGSVRVFVRSGSTWTPQATLTASDGAAGDSFGASVSLDVNTLAAGASGDDVGANNSQGSVRVFVRSGSTWSPQATLTPSDGAALDQFGLTLSLSGDTLAVGHPFDAVGVNYDQGSVRLFVRSGSTWTPQATLTAGDGAANDQFGDSVSLSGDSLAVGDPGDDVTVAGQGSVRLFLRSGTTWTPRATMVASAGGSADQLGTTVALAGETIATGATGDDVGANSNQGSVRIFGNCRVFNDTANVGYLSLAEAIAGSSAGSRLIVRAAAFEEASGIIDASQKRFDFVAVEPITVSATTLMTIATNTVFERSPEVVAAGLTVAGKLVAPVGGTVTFEHLNVGNQGQFLQRNSSILVNNGLSTLSGGACYLQGPVLAEVVSTFAGGQNRVAGDTDVFANYTNAGATIVQRGILYIYGTLINTGTMTGEIDNGLLPPTAGDGYSIGGDYLVGADASLVLPDPVWWLRVGGNLDIAIDDPSRFVMDRATIELTGLGPAGSQTLETLSDNLGATASGFAASNFPIGSLRLRAGATVELVDAHSNVPGKAAEVLYFRSLVVPAGATLVTNGLKIFAETASIAGTVSNAADIVIVPGTPPCVADLNLDHFVDGYDLSILLGFWNTNPTSLPRADINADGVVNAIDLGFVLAGWGACAE